MNNVEGVSFRPDVFKNQKYFEYGPKLFSKQTVCTVQHAESMDILDDILQSLKNSMVLKRGVKFHAKDLIA